MGYSLQGKGNRYEFRVLVGSPGVIFWDHFGFLGGPWGVPGGSLGGPGGVPEEFLGEPGGFRHRSGTGTPKKCPKCVTVVKTGSGHFPPARRATGFWDHLGSPYLTLLEPYSVPLLGKKLEKLLSVPGT